MIDTTDEFRFRKESPTPSGLIQWRRGEKLIESARRTLLAGAKSFIAPGRHYVNRHGGFANRYLDQVLMGQTEPGSYIVTAYAPPAASVTLRGGSPQSARIVEAGAAQVRAVNEAVVRALEATSEALEHYKSRGSLSGFEDGVSHGVSYEMTNAILGVTNDADEADVSIEWDTSTGPAPELESHFVFRPSDIEPLTRAAVKLAQDESSQVVTVMGRVHILAKKAAGSPGVFGIDSLQPDGPRKVRVRLADEEDYHEAIRAHEEDLAILVSGTLEKEGNLSWLYGATVIQTLDHVDTYRTRQSRGDHVPGQLDMFAEEN
ncbi:hypothetical protein [Actinomadura decatromicini]|uniref:Uncharacterized protein n=1 Tax=Actinomadura decatromicini TaxID=2604572 RepID=A0A5D3FRI9_9ACTN|nr:hypothetical protein [Actinomadura decatromicini]TYK50719.1 hypothetical protein FXF68_09515 [Actinomadura decatromicini]